MTIIPRDPSGDSALVQTVKQILKCLRERTIIPDQTTTQCEYTPQGTKVKVIGRGGRGGGELNVPRWG
jgi:hypothetical protein